MLIEIKNLNKYYLKGQENEVHALNDVNLSVSEGDLIGITGPSGSGKSTFLHVLAGITNFDSGSYYFTDIDMFKAKDKEKAELRNKKIGVVMQNFGLLGELTVSRNVAIPMLISHTGKKEINKRTADALEKVGMSDYSSKKVNQLSGGQKQRIAIARALCMGSQVILADEPTGALDSNTTQSLLNLIKDLNETGITFLIATHNPMVDDFCKKHVKIIDGKLSS